MKVHYIITTGFSILLSFFFFVFLEDISFPWVDECQTSDAAITLVKSGIIDSHVSGVPSFSFYTTVLAGWYWLFGISHTATCSLELLFALLTYLSLLYCFYKWESLCKPLSLYIFTLLYWICFNMPALITMGRVDMAEAFICVLIVYQLVEKRMGKGNIFLLLLWSTLLTFNSIYGIPYIFAIGVFVAFLPFDNIGYGKWRYLKESMPIVFVGFILGFGIGRIWDLCHGHFYHFLARQLSHIGSPDNGFFDRLLSSYLNDIPLLIMSSAIIVVLLYKGVKFRSGAYMTFVFSLCIPLVMTIGGRYQGYYHWMSYLVAVPLFIYTIDRFLSPKVALALSAFLILVGTYSTIIHIDLQKEVRRGIGSKTQNNELAKKIVDNLPNMAGENVIINDLSLYYPLISADATLWYFFQFALPFPQDSPNSNSDSWLSKVKSAVRSHDEPLIMFPPKGVFVLMDKSEKDYALNYLQSQKYDYKVKVVCNNYWVISFVSK